VRRAARERRRAEAAAPAPAQETRRGRNARLAREYWAGRRDEARRARKNMAEARRAGC